MARELILLIVTYLVASIPFGLIVGKVWGAVDVRRVGSGNIGTSNVMRSVGKGAAAVVLLLDVCKGTVPVWIAHGLGFSDAAIAAICVAAVAGHVWSIFLRFNGGKGVATALGVMLGVDGWVALSLIAVWLVVLILTRYISVASVLAALWLPIALWLFTQAWVYVGAGCAISALAIWRHRGNIQRLLAGTEYRFGERVGRAERG